MGRARRAQSWWGRGSFHRERHRMRLQCAALKAALLFLLFLPVSPSAQTPAVRHEVRIAQGVAEKLLIRKVYPAEECIEVPARVTGTVVLAIEIGTDGSVLHPKVISGPELLQKVALDVVDQYKYRPYLLNGKAIEVGTTVSIHFDLFDSCS